MRFSKTLVLTLILLIFMSACSDTSNACPPGSVTYAEDDALAGAEAPPEFSATPAQVEIDRKTLLVDRVISGPLCNETLQGTVYVACEVQVKKWVDKPTFLDGCNFNVAPGTVIYVAAHNDMAYYNGCASCHASQAGQP